MLAVVASSYLFDRLVRDRWGAAARWATLWFAAGVVTLLADGQLTFALGVAFGLAALRALQLGRVEARARRRRGLRPLQPGRRRLPRRRRRWSGALAARRRPVNRVAVWRRRPIALGLTVVPNLAFPEPGQFPFAFSSFVAIPLWCGGALFVTRGLRARSASCAGSLAGYLLASTADLAGARTRWAATRSASAPSSAARCSPRSCSPAAARVAAWFLAAASWPAASTGS